MLVIGQRIDGGDAAVLGELHHILLRKGADDGPMNHAAHHTGSVLDRLTTAELDVGAGEEHDLTTELTHADLEAHACACGGLREDQRPLLAGEHLPPSPLRNGGEHCDNVTVIALEWETPDAFESTRGISTDSISDGVFASTIQAGVLDTAVEDLDDAAIERSIAEINEAIRRSAARKG